MLQSSPKKVIAACSLLLFLTLLSLPALGSTALEWFNIAQTLWDEETGKFTVPKKAIDYLNNAIRLDPTHAPAYNSRGNAYADLELYQRAIEDYNKAIYLRPDYIHAYINRSDAYYSLKQYQHAINDCTTAIRIQPYMAIAYSNRGKAYAKLNNFTAAIKDFDEAIRLNPRLANAYNNRAFAHLLQGNQQAGCPDAQKACSLGLYQVLKWAGSKGKCLPEKSVPSSPGKEETKIIPQETATAKTPEKQPSPQVENIKPASKSAPGNDEVKKIRGIELTNGTIIEGQIISLNSETVKIRTKDGTILSYSFQKDVRRFIQ